MNVNQMKYIITIAENQSIVKASEELYISQAALSQMLSKLKKKGLPPIFYRKDGKLLLTDSGKIYVNGARHILSILEECEKTMSDLKK